MLNLIKKDYLFTKKMILFSLLYCAVVPIVVLVDNDGKTFFADLLIPLALVTAPLAKITSKEDTKSGVIFQKTLPYSSFEKVGARFLFVFSLLVMSDIILSVIKQFVFKTQGFGDAVIQSIPVIAGFAVYYAVYLTVYYWKGHFATQFCIYFLIVILVLGKNLVHDQVTGLAEKVMSNKVSLCLATIGILACFYLISCILDQRKRIDK